MLYAITALFAFQLLGELLVGLLGLPLPGALAGMLLLLAALLALGHVPEALEYAKAAADEVTKALGEDVRAGMGVSYPRNGG